MSGGVDSAVAAALCARSGARVLGLMLRLWSEPEAQSGNRCCTPDAVDDARAVADLLGIPFQVFDAREVFQQHVVEPFVAASAAGSTLNPCLACNRHVRFGTLLRHAVGLGADTLATGHYARVLRDREGVWRLLRGVDPTRDQSYVLHVLGQAELARALFPVGEIAKARVRELARELGLPVAARPDSTDLCWVGDGGVDGFLERRLGAGALPPGPILDGAGRRLGTHRGLARYTVGQRRGLGLSAGRRMYVGRLDTERNALIVVPEDALGAREVRASDWHWVAGAPAGPAPWRVSAQIRYRAPAAAAWLRPTADGMLAVFDHEQRAPTPGQGLVAYAGETCLGGGLVVGPGGP